MSLLDPFLNFIFNPWFIVSLIFWIIVGILIFLLRNKKEAYYVLFPLLIMFKTKRLNNFITNVGQKCPKFWRVFWTIGIFVSFGFTIFALWFFFTNIINLLFSPSIEYAVTPLIPGVTIDLPIFAFLLLPLLFIVTTHEFAHGISATADGVEVESTGVLGAGIFYLIGFGAFVEVNERKLRSNKFSRMTRLRISAAGTYINAITAGIAILLILITPFFISLSYANVPQVVDVLKTEEGGFNYGNITINDAIYAIKKQGQPDQKYIYLDNYNDITLDLILSNQTSQNNYSVGEIITLKVYNSDLNIETEREILLGPKYNLGIEYNYINNTALKLNYNKTSEESLNIIITEIDGTSINRTNGDTLEKTLTQFGLKTLNLTSNKGTEYVLELQVEDLFIGILQTSFYMYKNDLGKILTPLFPLFVMQELFWLFVISFSITLFNMLPLPIFDGDRIVKELINWGIGEDFSIKQSRTDKFRYKRVDNECELSEYRVEEIKSIKIILDSSEDRSEILLSSEKYNLIDKIGDENDATVVLDLPEDTTIKEDSLIEIDYEYIGDRKKKIKSILLNTIRIITLLIVVANFALSFLLFGFNLFWVP
ncbi:MAG: hypothetical protein GF317_17745 [Candidatus Lokiarchaeota archaeon]|nr:hypothetical protein [Candidatus Lokiarchaeota archaeon]MBD3201357.1 hypothetical protein [Candidatus Lokiarchaeota archaeon]